jgi:signal transduction histidine kinase
MFFGFSRADFSWPRWRRSLPIFLLLWGGGVILSLLWLATVRGHLEEIERTATENLLDTYLETQRAAARLPTGFAERYQTLPEGMVFVRIQQGEEQLLMVGEGVASRDYLSLPIDASGVWQTVGSGAEQRIVTIVSRHHGQGVVLQAGKDGAASRQLFEKMIRRAQLLVFASFVLFWPLALWVVRQSLAPLVATRSRVAELTGTGNGALLPEKGNGPEMDNLYREINKLVCRNRRLVKEMQNSLDNVAHDLRTPMTRLRSAAEYGLQADGDATRLAEALSDCLDESARVIAMLQIMMSVAEAESGTMSLSLSRVDLAASLGEVVELYEYVAEESGITVELLIEQPVSAMLDPTRIGQVWANLLDNALKYGRSGGWVRITLTTGENEVVVAFADNGIGISATEQERIWERLYRGDRSRSRPGLGLGLSYVRAVVATHGGSVAVSSTLHQGSCFTVRLPRVQATTQEKSQISGA